MTNEIKKRNEEYEKKFRKYLFSFDLETHKKICENLNVNHNQHNKTKTEKSLRERLLKLIKDEEKGGISFEDIKKEFHDANEEINKELKRLLEDGYIYEPRSNIFRWLG